MASIDQSNINKTSKIENLPSPDRLPRYTDTKLSNWIKGPSTLDKVGNAILGEDGYRNMIAYYKMLTEGINSPGALLYTVNRLLTGDVVKMPEHMSQSTLSTLRNLLSKWYGSGPHVDNERLYTDKEDTIEAPIDGGQVSNSGRVVKQPGRSSKNVLGLSKSDKRGYDWVDNRPENKNISNRLSNPSPEEVIKKLEKAGYKIGYKYVQGFEMGNNALWDIKLYPYDEDHGNPNECQTPSLPSYVLPNVTSKGSTDGVEFSFSEFCPVLSWQLQFGQLNSMSLPLFNGTSLTVPLGFQYNMILSLSILDDVYGSMDKYFRYYVNSTYNQQTQEVAPFWASAFFIPITLFRRGYDINYKFNIIGIPQNWAPTIEGVNEATTENRIQIDFSVIGLTDYDSSTQVFPDGIGQNKAWKKLTWDNITLRAN